MINYNNCSPYDRKIIDTLTSKGFPSFGEPIEIQGLTYLPVVERRLWLRYYISNIGYIYDRFTESIRKVNPNEVLEFEYNEEKFQYTFDELVWMTYYRFPHNGNNAVIERISSKSVLIDGIKFSQPFLSKRNMHVIFKECNKNIVVSKNGAICDLRKNEFIPTTLNAVGIPVVFFENCDGWRISYPITNLIACAFLHNIYRRGSHRLQTIDSAPLFLNSDNIMIENKHTGKYDNHNLFYQELYPEGENFYLDRINEKGHLVYKYGYQFEYSFHKIPLASFVELYRINTAGVISSSHRNIVKPKRIVYFNNEIVDVYYEDRNKHLYSIIDIYLWSFYRILRKDIKIYSVKFIEGWNGIPMLSQLSICGLIDEYITEINGIYINNLALTQLIEKFGPTKNYFISPYGAIFNIKDREFYEYNLNTVVEKKLTPVKGTDNKTFWIKLPDVMYFSWTGKRRLPFQRKIFYLNEIRGDVTVSNLIYAPMKKSSPTTVSKDSKFNFPVINPYMNYIERYD